MNLGRELLRIVVEKSELKPLLDSGLDQTWLESRNLGSQGVFSGTDREAYAWVLAHWAKHRKVPSQDLFRANFPEPVLPFADTGSTLDELIEEAVRTARSALIYSTITDIVKLYDDGHIDEAVEQLSSTTHQLNVAFTQQGSAVARIGDPDPDINKMVDTEVTPGIGVGSHWNFLGEPDDYDKAVRVGPFKDIDKACYGMQPGQLITLLGRQKAGKTTVMAHSAYHAWCDGYDVLFFSVEMDTDILIQRVLSIGARVSPERFRQGKLEDDEKARVYEKFGEFERDLDNAEKLGGVNFRISKKRALITMDDIVSEVQQYRPHIVYIDGFYFMRDRITGKTAGPDWQAHENLAAELKTFATAERIPICVSTQVQEKQHDRSKNLIEGSSMMGGTGLLRYSDLVLGLDKDKEDVHLLHGVMARYSNIPDIRFKIKWGDMTFDTNIEASNDTFGPASGT